jgi:hypothetical protein
MHAACRRQWTLHHGLSLGPARADLYWGAGNDAGRIAGRIRHPGSVRDAASARARYDRGRQAYAIMPLRMPKPKIPEIEVKNLSGQAGSAKPDDDRRAATLSRRQAAPPRWIAPISCSGRPAARCGMHSSLALEARYRNNYELRGTISSSLATCNRRPTPCAGGQCANSALVRW